MNARLFVSQIGNLIRQGILLGDKSPSGKLPGISSRAPKVLIFSPHPDDECIVGGVALRLLREAAWNVINVAVTLGSKRERRMARLRELKRACLSLGFDLIVPEEQGLDRITLDARKHNKKHWNMAVKVVAGVLLKHRPRVILIPHESDGHPAHIGTHFLVLDALRTLPSAVKCHVIETEFWAAMPDPNLLVELGVDDVANLISALACHKGEVRRNPYHARLPAWMIDNVRRGAELVGFRGGGAPDFTFGTIYRLSRWSKGRLVRVQPKQRFLSSALNPQKCFE